MILIDIAGTTLGAVMLLWFAVEFTKAVSEEIRDGRA